jgi:DNA-binding NarL/FixJ family response regulator
MKPLDAARAKEIIFAQEALLSIKRSAWVLYQHEVTQVNPLTKRRYTPRQALRNVLRWMAIQKKRGTMSRIEFTSIQTTILQLLVVEGLTYKEIALQQGVKLGTIMDHMARIRAKMGLRSTHQVVAVVVEYGLVGVPRLE